MRAVYMAGPGDVSTVEYPPCTAGKEDVLIRVHRVGLCGTDLQSYRGIAALTQFPLVPGHEVGGEVISCGKEVPAGMFFPGEHVTVRPYFHCGHCYPCRVGRINCCENSRTMGVQLSQGALRDMIAVPYQNVVHGGELSYEECAIIEPLAVGAHLVNRTQVTAGENVLVFGCGIIGTGVIAAACRKGARVILAEIAREKFAFAQSLGAVCIDPQTQDLRTEVDRLTDGAGVSVALEAIGCAQTMESAIDLVNFAGRVGYVGYCKDQISLCASSIVKKELTIVGSRNALSQEFEEVRACLAAHRISNALVSGVYPVNETAKAFADWDAHPGNVMKIQISFDDPDR